MRICLIFILALFSLNGSAQPGYKIDFKIRGLQDTTIYLGFFQGEGNKAGTYLKDTARVDAHGSFTFEGSKTLNQGIYFLVLNKNRLFDLVISSDQHFSIETDPEDYYGHAKVTGDEDNRLYFDYTAFDAESRKEADPFVSILRDSTASKEKKTEAQEVFRKINEKVIGRQTEIIENYPATMTARFFKATKQLEVPDPPKKEDGTIDSTFQFRYYRDHYFDAFDLSDDALYRLPKPFYQEKIKDYLDRLIVQDPDTLTKAIEKMISKAKKNPETYKIAFWICFTHYQSHPIMGLDEVYVNLYDKYIATGEMDYWLDKSAKQSIKEYVNKVRLSLIGNTAPNLIMQDQNFQPRSMYDLKKKYTILFIFNPDCGHCREETPKLVKFYNHSREKLDLEVYAVSTDTSMKKMRDYIKEMKTNWVTVNGPRTYVGIYSKLYHADTTPALYIIDDKHKIVGKKILADQLDEFFEKYEKILKKQPASNKGT